MAKAKSAHVTKNDSGGWKVVPANQKPVGTFPTQKEAQDAARRLLQSSGGGELVTHDRKGQIRDKDTIAPGNDPHPPQG